MRNMYAYLDSLSSLCMPKEVFIKLENYFVERVGKPGARHQWGQWNKASVDYFKENIQEILNTERDISISIGLHLPKKVLSSKTKTAIVSPFESDVVLNSLKYFDFKIIEAPMSSFTIDLIGLASLIEKRSVSLVVFPATHYIMGKIQPINEIANICRTKDIHFILDITPLIGRYNFDIKEFDNVFINGQPLGIPCDIVIGDKLLDISYTPLIASISGIIEYIFTDYEQKVKKLYELTEYFESLLKIHLPDSIILGDENRIAGVSAVAFNGASRGEISICADLQGVALWAGKNFQGPLNELTSCGVDAELTESIVRFSFWHHNTTDEIDYALRVIPPVVERLKFERGKS